MRWTTGFGFSPLMKKGSNSWSSYWTQQIDIFKKTLQNNLIWDKLDLINLGFSGTSAYKNLKDDSVVCSLSNDSVAFLEDRVGFFTNAKTGYIDYTWNPATVGNKYSLNSAYFGIFSWIPIVEQTIISGCSDLTGYLSIIISRNNNTFRYRMNMGITEKTFTYTGETDGYFSLSKTNNSVTAARNGVGLNTSTVTTVAVPNMNIRGLANNYGDTIAYTPSINKLGAIIAGEYLTPSEDLILATALNTLIDNIAEYPEYYDSGNIRYAVVGFNNKDIKGVDGDRLFAVSTGTLWMSTNKGLTWSSKALSNAIDVDSVMFFDSGTVIFSITNKLYRSADALANIAEITPKLPGGADYTIHTPVNASNPGKYYQIAGRVKKMYRGGDEIFIFGNYGNESGGAVPTNIYELTNDGQNLTVIYQFGQNPYYTDDGTDNGGVGGNLLGDAGNDTKVRHLHSVIWDEDSSTVYFCTGDKTQVGPFNECLWGQLVYSEGTYTPTILVSGSEATQYKSASMQIINGEIYYVSDSSTVFGVWKTSIANIANSANHIQLLTEDAPMSGLARDGNNLIANIYTGELKVWISGDWGSTWDEIWLTNIPGYPDNCTMFPIGIIDSDGYIWYHHNFLNNQYTLKIKIKVI